MYLKNWNAFYWFNTWSFTSHLFILFSKSKLISNFLRQLGRGNKILWLIVMDRMVFLFFFVFRYHLSSQKNFLQFITIACSIALFFHRNTNVHYFEIKKFSQLKHISQRDLILRKSYNLNQIMLTNRYFIYIYITNRMILYSPTRIKSYYLSN